MFHQVRVREDDCDALRFLWWPNGNLDQKPKIYCMNVHLFGATSSPSCTAYALKRTARDYAHLFDQVALTVERNFYVDDCLKSVPSEQQAIKLATDLQSMLKWVVSDLQNGSHLCKEKFGWDEQIPQEYHDKWKSWVKNLPCLENLSVNRCFLPRDVQHVKNVQLHIFSDGSELGYGACAYLRVVDENDRTTCSYDGKSSLSTNKTDQWRHVDSKQNPADIASRGIDACDRKNLDIWLNGPKFLHKNSEHWPRNVLDEELGISETDTEIKKEIAVHATTTNAIDNLLGYFSDWIKLRRAIAWFRRF
ncbi:unnamed protein product [Mytilus edulis]|uniref:Uncharacterized protein n=1 Tax=Mytilus edulis TaxID=6550 RepID=A0A8S3TCP6_MYTED|nr:unnamed protein product [Mytilus edulis]